MISYTSDPTGHKREYMQAYRQTPEHKEYVRLYNKAYREKHKDTLNAYNKEYKKTRLVQTSILNKSERQRLKLAVLSHYAGGVPTCATCGFTEMKALQLDHIENNGADSRRRLMGSRTAAGTTYYRYLRKNNYPSGYQVLCANCNVIKFHNTFDAEHTDTP